MVKRKQILLLFLPLLLLVNGCKTDPYTASMAGSKDVSDAVSGALPIISQLQQDKLVSDAQTKEALEYLSKVTQANQLFRTTVKQIKASGQTGPVGYLNAADTFVKSVESQSIVSLPPKLQTALSAVDTAIRGVEVAVSNAKGTVK